MSHDLHGYFLGRRPYVPTLALMERFFEARRRAEISDSVLLLEHEPVITLGRGAKAENLLANEQELQKLGVGVVTTGRGGDITLHAPGQLIAYPLLDLNPHRRDVRKYVQTLTEVMKRIVSPHGIDAGTIDAMIGLWADAAQFEKWRGQAAAEAPVKLGAIGVRISRWVTAHGFALNLTTDLSLYRWIIPCGIREYPVASVQSLTGATPDLREEALKSLTHLGELFSANSAQFYDCSATPLEEVLPLAQSLSPANISVPHQADPFSGEGIALSVRRPKA